MKILLIVSLALNLLVAGVVVGGLIRHGLPGEHRSAAGPGGIGATVIRALPQDTRQTLREELSKDGYDRASDPLAAAPVLLDELRSEDYDAQAFAEALREVRRSRDERRTVIELALSREIDTMSAAERSAYADQLEQMLRDPARRSGR